MPLRAHTTIVPSGIALLNVSSSMPSAHPKKSTYEKPRDFAKTGRTSAINKEKKVRENGVAT
jgi:hypothetical protein